MNEDMKADPLENLNNVDFPGIKQEIVKEEICEEELPDLPNYVTVKDEMVINKLDTDLQQEVHKTDPEGQLSRSEHSVGDSGDTEQLSPLKIKTECEFEEFDQPEQIPVEDIDSILFEGTETKVKSEFGSTEDSNEQTDEILEKDSASHVETQPVSIKTLFKCEVCSKGYVSEPPKNRHMRVHFGKGPVPCTMCGEEFEKRTCYIQHYGTHFEELYQFHCLGCYNKFPTQAKLDEHRTAHHDAAPKLEPEDAPLASQKRYPCRYCSKDFPNRSDLLGHESLHNGKKLSQCPICQKNFAKPVELHKHERTHTGSRPFSCELCSKSYVQQGALTVHRKIAHSNEKAFRCGECPKIFAYGYSLRRHLRHHRGERPHKCDECSMSFPSRYALDEHVTIHTGELPFACTQCPQRFRRPWYLKSHYRVHASTREVRRFQCGACDKSFSTNEILKRHGALHGDQQFKCSTCWKAFKNEINLEKHKLIYHTERVGAQDIARPFDCHLCARRFTTKYKRDTHVGSHPTEPLPCGVCDKRFEKKENLRMHLRVHSENRFTCEVCSKVFRNARNHRRHMTIHSKVEEVAV